MTRIFMAPYIRKYAMVLALAAFAVLVVPATGAYAMGTGTGTGTGGGMCPGNGLLARIVPCISDAIEQSTYKLATAMSNYLFPAISIFVVLAIIIYGVKVMSPEGNPRRTAIPFVLKIAFILLFVQNFGGFIPAVHGGIKEVVDILANALTLSSQCPEGSGIGGGGGIGAAVGSEKIWTQMDCILGKLFGFAGKDGNATLIASVFGLLAGFLFGGSFGIIAFMGVIGILWSILMFVFRAAFAFLNGFLLGSFAVIISPMFIPLLLMHRPAQYFRGWYDMLMSAFLMPLLVVGYCVFALSIYNKVLFESERGETLRKTMEKTFAQSITGMRTECLGTLINNFQFLVKGGTKNGGGGSADQLLKNDSVQNPAVPQQSAGQGLCIKIPNIDLQKMMGNFKNKQDFFRKIFSEGISIFLLAWLLSTGLQAIIPLAMVMARSAATLMTPLSDIEKRMHSMMKNAEKKAHEAFSKEDGSSASGVDFIRSIPGALKNAGTGLLNG